MSFIVPPLALVLAVSSVRRAYSKGVPSLLSWLAVLISGATTLNTIGLLSQIIEAIQGAGG